MVRRGHAFFRKGWAQYELDGPVTMAVSGAQVLRVSGGAPRDLGMQSTDFES
jgi:hypothetical protein